MSTHMPASQKTRSTAGSQQAPARLRRHAARKTAKRMVAAAGAFAVVFGALAVLLSWAIDPLQLYHKSWYPPVYSSEERYQNAGLARHYDYDTIILGTSMTENFLPSIVGQALGGKAMKLSIRGSTIPEQYDTANLALATDQVKTVLWGIDYFALRIGQDEAEDRFPSYMYDDSYWNDYKYWFSITPYEQLGHGIMKLVVKGEGGDLERLDNWNRWVTFDRKEVLADYRKARQQEAYYGTNEAPLADVQQAFVKYVLSVVKAHPEVQFRFYYPPYSILRHVVWQETNPVRFENQIYMRKWMFEQLSKLPNAWVYDFQGESRWTFDLDQYKDLSHHREEVNSAIAEAVGRNDSAYRITDQNVDSMNELLESQVRTYVIMEDGKVRAVPVQVNGKDVLFSTRIAADGDIFVPAKEASVALKANLEWDVQTKTLTVSKGSNVLKMTMGKSDAARDERKMEAQSPIKLIKNRLQIPLIFVSKQLGFQVERPALEPAITPILIRD
ncbi:copper amine oxidase domain protein [Paenibacillus curdlanolyticus YK9]|uniref:Copper amine oxidase domain protein n=1 Tax=Paenibacillus curdlanolyticus YK9 TaxID=717606 RepID=E0I2Z3_9BACL|nr:copper amine oxidase N-terminal domain-containing protein [Paenibacillus curdlanolyticus]EFM12657.1 copper amine oxidase domain protein [Paenibacillus curdlanolyticus YK9]